MPPYRMLSIIVTPWRGGWQVKGKVNAITVDSCTRTGLVFQDMVAACELVNSAAIQVQVTGVVPTIAVDKCDGVQVRRRVSCQPVLAILGRAPVAAKAGVPTIAVDKCDGVQVSASLLAAPRGPPIATKARCAVLLILLRGTILPWASGRGMHQLACFCRCIKRPGTTCFVKGNADGHALRACSCSCRRHRWGWTSQRPSPARSMWRCRETARMQTWWSTPSRSSFCRSTKMASSPRCLFPTAEGSSCLRSGK